MKKCFIIDEDEKIFNVIQNCIKQLSTLQLARFSSSSPKAIRMILDNKPDLIFFDKNMKEENFEGLIEMLDRPIKIIICNCFSEEELNRLDLDTVEYLMNSISFETFEKAIQKKIAKFPTTQLISKEIEIPNDYIFVKTESKGKMVKLDLKDINYIEGMNNYVAFHTIEKVIISHFTLRQLEEMLPKSNFIRVHKSYIVPIKKVVGIAKQELKISSLENTIPLSPNFRAAFLERVHAS